MQRREFLKLSIGTLGATALGRIGYGGPLPLYSAPNILVILVDEMRALDWIPKEILPVIMPNLTALMSKSANFNSYYTAASACSSARASMLTGLYSHQTGVITNYPGLEELPSEMPTYGHFLRGFGYDTYWYGKWHLDGLFNTSLEKFGFSGGTFPDPQGFPWQGKTQDASITSQFTSWLRARALQRTGKKWCTTVSLVNPHDVTGFWKASEGIEEYAGPFNLPKGWLDAGYFQSLGGLPCANFENPFTNTKPALQAASAGVIDSMLGAISRVPGVTGSQEKPFAYWYKLLQFYTYLHSKVDVEIGKIIQALYDSSFAKNTVVIFTADHGEYAGAHGLQGKNGSAYEEAIRIPLLVYDPSQKVAKSPSVPRSQLFSSVDFAPLLMTLACGGDSSVWRKDSRFSYLNPRAEIHEALVNPLANGRDFVLFASDEWLPILEVETYHILMLRTRQAKLTLYSAWRNDSPIRRQETEEIELYDYRSGDRNELHNSAENSELTAPYRNLLVGPNGNEGIFRSEMNARLPSTLESARTAKVTKYLKTVNR